MKAAKAFVKKLRETSQGPSNTRLRQMRLFLYDTTLRDGAQRSGLSFSVDDKLRIARVLDEFGIPYIEGGWPGANPKDVEFFRRANLKHARLVAFGMTRSDCLEPLLEANTPTVAIVGKSSLFHVRQVLGVEPCENLSMIGDCVRRLKRVRRAARSV